MKKFLKKFYNYGNDYTLGLGKELILGLIILFVGLFNFGNCATVSSLLPLDTVSDFTVGTSWTLILSLPPDFDGTYCLKFNNPRDYVGSNTSLQIGNSPTPSNPSINFENYFHYFANWYGNYVCSYTAGGWTYIYARVINNSLITLDYESFILNDLLDSDLPIYSTEQCQSEYSLMPIDSCDSEYCEMNNLCTGSNNSNWSLLYINDILHEGAPIINVRIPEEIQRDYTGNLEQFDLDVKGYGYDQDKMQQMVNTQRMTPDGEEMSNLIAKIADFLPLIAVALLIIWIRRVVKKVFKF